MKIEAHTLQKTLIYCIYALIFFLPLYEAPKNIAIVFVLALWTTRSLLTSDWGGSWSKWDTSAIFIMLAGFGSVFFGHYPVDKGVISAGDILSYSMIFMLVRRMKFDGDVTKNIILIMIASTFITLLLGYWLHFYTKSTGHLQLNSVGHVNHSAIYLAIVTASALALMVSKNSLVLKVLITTIFAVFAYSIFVMSARGTIIPLVLFVFLVAIYKAGSLRQVAIYAFGIFLALGSLVYLQPGVLDKSSGNIKSLDYSSKRLELANTAFVAAKESPVFGSGLNNFWKISESDVKYFEESRGRVFDPSRFYFSSHAHNLYFNTLATQGIVGLLAVLLFIGMIGHHLFTNRPRNGQAGSMLWYGALGAFVVVVFGGVFNTTLHHEHGMLAMLVFALYLSNANGRLASNG